AAGQASNPVEEHSWRGRSDGSDVGAGSERPAPVLFGGECGELLRVDVRVGFIGRQTAARADRETTQRAFANGADRGGESSPAVEPAVGSRARAGSAAGNRNRATLAV